MRPGARIKTQTVPRTAPAVWFAEAWHTVSPYYRMDPVDSLVSRYDALVLPLPHSMCQRVDR